MKIKFHIQRLALNKGEREGRIIRPIDIARETNISERTVYKWWNNEPLNTLDVSVLLMLGQYFGCQLGEIASFTERESAQNGDSSPQIKTLLPA